MNWRPLAWKAADVSASTLIGALAIWSLFLAGELVLAFVVWRQPQVPSFLIFRAAFAVSAAFQAWRAIRKKQS